MNRYIECGEEVKIVFNRVVTEGFPVHCSTKFMLVFDTKKRIRKGRITLASIESTNDKTKFFTMSDENPDGADYIIIIDQIAWEYAKEVGRVRLLSHELCHAFIDEKGRFKIVDHDITDFVSEIKRNQDDPDWSKNLVDLVASIYDQKEDID